jgi:hypothetical protein
MVVKADLTIQQVEDPVNRWCSSGHIAPITFKLDGSNGKEEPTRFFHIIGKGINGIYCEPCLCIANWAANQQKKLSKGK